MSASIAKLLSAHKVMMEVVKNRFMIIDVRLINQARFVG